MPARISRDERRRALESRLLDAIERLAREGVPFSQVTVERLAAETAISRSTFYFHYADKAALAHALGERLLDDLAARSTVLWDDPPPGRDGLLDAVRGVLRLYRDRYAVFAAVTETAAADESVFRLLSRRLETIGESLATQIESAQQLGGVRAVPLPETAHAFITLLERTCYAHLRDADDARLDRHAEVLTTIMWNTLVGTDRPGP